MVRAFFSVRRATPEMTFQVFTRSRPRHPRPSARAASQNETSPSTIANPNPSASACQSQPVMIRLRTHSIMYETGLSVAAVWNQLDLDEVARRVHRRDEQEDEEHGEERLDRLARAGSVREPGAERAERERHDGPVDEEDGDPREVPTRT